MVDADEAKLKAEIDEIAQHIDSTMKKIEQVVPLNSVSNEQTETDETESNGETPPPEA